MEIPFSKPSLDKQEAEAAAHVLSTGWLAAGPETDAFEQEFSTYISPGGEHYYCIFTASCTAALKMAYKFLQEQGETYIDYPVNTFCATYSSAIEIGLDAMPYDKNDHYSGNTIRVNMHYGGVKDETPCLIEDSAHRIEPNDPLVGKIRCYSFYATKNMTTGSGGMFVTNDKEIYERARLYWRDGLSTSSADRLHGKQGYEVLTMAGGYDSNDILAAIGRVQLKKLPAFTKRRNEIVSAYNCAFGKDWVGNHLYPFFVPDEAEAYRMIEWMKKQGIHCGHHYPGTGWKGVSLPLYPLMTDEEVNYIIDKCKQYATGL